MFEHDLIKRDDYSTKSDSVSAYVMFLKQIGQSEKEYPYSLEGLNTYKGKPVTFTVSGWGGYFNADNVWTIFVAYRSFHPKHTIQHVWSWNEDTQTTFNHRVFEFIN